MTGLLWRFPELAVLALLVAGSLRVPQLIPVAVLAAGWMCVQEVRARRALGRSVMVADDTDSSANQAREA